MYPFVLQSESESVSESHNLNMPEVWYNGKTKFIIKLFFTFIKNTVVKAWAIDSSFVPSHLRDRSDSVWMDFSGDIFSLFRQNVEAKTYENQQLEMQRKVHAELVEKQQNKLMEQLKANQEQQKKLTVR